MSSSVDTPAPVPVHIVTTDEPSETRFGTAFNRQVSAQAIPLLSRDRLRHRAIIVSVDGAVQVAKDPGTAQAGQGAVLPIGAQVVIEHTDEVWCANLTGNSTVSVLVERREIVAKGSTVGKKHH